MTRGAGWANAAAGTVRAGLTRWARRTRRTRWTCEASRTLWARGPRWSL
jgi:hypothetical protein